MNFQLQKVIKRAGKYYRPFIIGLMTLIVFGLVYSSLEPRRYEINLNRVANETIRAPYTIEDEEQTAINQDRAREAVPDVFLYHPDIREGQLNIIERFFSEIRTIRSDQYTTEMLLNAAEELQVADQLTEQIDRENRTETQEVNFGQLNNSERLIAYFDAVANIPSDVKDLADNLSQTSILYILTINDTNLTEFQTMLTNITSEALESDIYANELIVSIQEISREAISNYQMTAEQQAIQSFLQQLIVPTMVYNEEETEANREEAAAEVPPSYILQGQVIIQEGHIVDAQSMHQLELYNILDTDAPPYILFAFVAILILHAFVLYRLLGEDDQLEAGITLTAYSLVLTTSTIILKGMYMIQENGTSYFTLLFPAIIIPLLLNKYVRSKFSLLAFAMFIIFSMFIFNNGDNILSMVIPIIYYVLSGLTAFILAKLKHNKLYHHEFMFNFVVHFVFAISIITIFSFDVFSNTSYMLIIYMLLNLTAGYGINLLIYPYWDQLLSEKAALTLNQLGNLNHPLLKKLIEVAPGTYNHSILVGNLSANAVEAIGGDSLLTRVASYYHDVGKTVHPLFFIENLPTSMESPHQMISDEESAQIIIGHVTEGVKLLEEYNIPKSVIDICKQHHGTTVVQYFYHQAKKDNPSVDIKDFTYPGPVPQTKEAVVIMLADSIEAASRTMEDHSQVSIEQLVTKIIDGKMNENQFAESPLTVHELKKVKASLISGVGSMYHTRIQYPE
ncbi:HD family phosphohydrolase [Fundicoccus culcitae]|uniref:HDIG domain-containing protein n=1 Tax=Fundicoccus culcitae TaxID=2969821 RepID=A0ABY5P796_9LACT|nr:HDIG domain-containing metalloprotein [Fundicoccus culcitae]UUX34355.1 HDIG domain-containing protein [Fundicoccus culcitae]